MGALRAKHKSKWMQMLKSQSEIVNFVIPKYHTKDRIKISNVPQTRSIVNSMSQIVDRQDKSSEKHVRELVNN